MPVRMHVTGHDLRDGKLAYGVTVDDGTFAGSRGTTDDPTPSSEG